MVEEKDDILSQAENIISQAGKENKRSTPISASREGNFFFMGGAYAGEVLQDKKEVTTQEGIKQLHLEYLEDPDDIGDLGGLLNYINEEGLQIINAQNAERRARFTPWSTNRVFFIKDGALYASTPQGLLPPDEQRSATKEKPLKITNDSELAQQMFDKISALPTGTKGRKLFSVFGTTLKENPDKLKHQVVSRENAMIEFDDDDLEHWLEGISDENEREHLRKWFLKFKGKVPASWERWYSANEDLEKNKGNSPPENWLDAAVTHPHWAVVNTACNNYKLSSEQLAIALVQLGEGWRGEDAIQAQKLRGLTQEELIEAKKLVTEQGTNLLEAKFQE